MNPVFTGDPDQGIEMARAQIAQGDDPKGWQAYIDELLKVKAQEPNYAEGEPPGLSKAVYKRLYYMKMPVEPKELVPKSSIINKNAIMQAYRTGKLEVRPGLVTYWLDGKRISDYVVEDMAETGRLVNDAYSNGRAFYIEKPEMEISMAALAIPPSNVNHMHNVWLSVKHENSQVYRQLQFIEDTGSISSSTLQSDVELLTHTGGTPHYMCDLMMQTVNSTVIRPVYRVVVKMLGQGYQNAPDAQAVVAQGLQPHHLGESQFLLHVCVHPDLAIGGIRLLGPFLHEYFFTGTAPDGRGDLIVSTNKSGLIQKLLAVEAP